VGSDLVVVFVAIFWREDYRLGRNAVTHDCRSNTNSGHPALHRPKCRPARHNLTQDKWLDGGALTDAGNALVEQRFRNLDDNPHASVPREEAKLRLMAPFKR
jgi:hypothetical protein